MGIKWNPKTTPILSPGDLQDARTQAQEHQNSPILGLDRSPNTPRPPDSADLQSRSPQEGLPPPLPRDHLPDSTLNQLAELISSLSSEGSARIDALKETQRWVLAYPTRRSRAGRRASSELLTLALEADPEGEFPLLALRDVLLAESELSELNASSAWNAARLLLPHAGSEGPLRARAQALLARTLTQLALHFPNEFNEEELSLSGALEQAFYLAESAASEQPDLPDGHGALGCLLLIHPSPPALSDAIALFELALSLDPEFDPARLGLASALFAGEDVPGALREIDTLSHRGCPWPGLFSLRARLKSKEGDVPMALRDAERATRLAPEAGLFWFDAAQVAESGGQPEAAQTYARRAEELLGAYYHLAREAT